MFINSIEVKGAIDDHTRCKHYHSEFDRIAIKFYCCQSYFPCYYCHKEYGCGNEAVWPLKKFNEKAILCGSCKKELTIIEYQNSHHQCPFCQAKFNEGCLAHEQLYFETKRIE